MSLLFTPLTRTASESMNRARGASPDNADLETSNNGGHDVDDDEDSITQKMKQLRMQARGSAPSLSVTDLMSNTKSKVGMFFAQRTTSQVMYKSEDLRQDQLVVQMITLIDRFLEECELGPKADTVPCACNWPRRRTRRVYRTHEHFDRRAERL